MEKEKEFKKERRAIASFMKRLYKQGLTTTSGGNISMRISPTLVLITPSATDKGRMKWNEVAIIEISGRNLTPWLKPSIETEMHLSIYHKNSAVKAIVHAHPVFASSFTASRQLIRTDLTAEACAILGEPLMVPYELMGTGNLAEKVSEYSMRSGILLLENHGILCTGTGLLQAFDRLEVLENAAKMTMITSALNNISPLTTEQVREIKRIFK